MNTTFSVSSGSFQLYRFPAQFQHPSLQAWGSEDELAINTVLADIKNLGSTLILNDEFGALGCALAAHLSADSVWQSDSYIAKCALDYNLAKNKLNANFKQKTSTDILSGPFDTVLLRLPKSKHYLNQQLRQLKRLVTANTTVIAFGKVKSVTTPVLQAFESVLGSTKTSLAVKKSRLIYCSPSPSKLSQHAEPLLEQHWDLPKPINNKVLTLCNLANVFAAKQLDIGARMMIDHLPPFNDEKVLDLGCGNGVLGLVTLAQSAHAHLTFVDESYMAVESAKRNLKNNLADKLDCADFVVDNCLDSFIQNAKQDTYDRVLCNPPFHQQNTLTDHIAWQMFNDAKYCLKAGGKLWVVGNRHLAYHDKLKRIFGGTKILASNAKFVILEAINRK